ncbi:MAG: DNA-directed RNA polymerase subunit alpha C-terminal domain-containing protein [Gammaproteobacteria bacterium]
MMYYTTLQGVLEDVLRIADVSTEHKFIRGVEHVDQFTHEDIRVLCKEHNRLLRAMRIINGKVRAAHFPIQKLRLSNRTNNVLERDGIKTVQELCNNSIKDLLSIWQFGRSALCEVREVLHSEGFYLKGESL